MSYMLVHQQDYLWQADHGNLAATHAAARHANLPAWVATAHPGSHGTDPQPAPPQTYLREIYPNLWQYGPAGDTYIRQLNRLKTLLELVREHIAVAIGDALPGATALFGDTTLISDLRHAAIHDGTPVPGTHILYGMDLAHIPTHPVSQLLHHPAWDNGTEAGYEAFDTFLYHLSLITLHRTWLANLSYPAITTTLREHADLCKRLGIPA